jgi:phosphatidylglycerol:prolipoprotein diacylglycerol transferase
VAVGHHLAIRRAARRGFEFALAWRVVTWTVLLGLVGSHLGAILLYEPWRALERPLLLLQVWGEMSSTGGIVGGAAGGWWAMRREGLDGARRLAFLDAIAFAFPFAWFFGRAGCALAHDHLGIPSTSLLAVAFPGGGRLDLGLLELLWTMVMCAAWLVLDRRPRPVGFFIAAWLLTYTPVRVVLDALRTEDARLFLGLTSAQVASAAGFGAGLWLALRLRRAPG